MVGLRTNAAFSAINIAMPLLGLAQDPRSPLRPGLQAELNSLAKESDPELFYADLYRLGRRIEKQRPDFALRLFSAVAEQAISPPLAKEARRNIDALEGRGTAGAQSEILLSRFIQNSLDPLMIAPMLAGSVVFGAVRAASAARLLGGSGWASRGLGLRLASSTAGYLAEVPSFVLASRGLRKLSSAELNPEIGSELASVAITLGVLKFAGAATRGLNLVSGKLNLGLAEASTFGGLLLAHSLEAKLGLRPTAGGNLLLDTLASVVSLGIGSRLGQRALGPQFSRWQMELNLRGNRPAPPVAGSSLLLSEKLAVPTGPSLPKPSELPSHIFAMSEGKAAKIRPSTWVAILKQQHHSASLVELSLENIRTLKKAIPMLDEQGLPHLALLLQKLQAQGEASLQVQELNGLYHRAVLNHLMSPDQGPFLKAIEAASNFGDASLLKQTIEIRAQDPNRTIRHAAAGWLLSHGDRKGLETLWSDFLAGDSPALKILIQAELSPWLAWIKQESKECPLETQFLAARLTAGQGDAESWAFLAENISSPLVRALLENLPPADPIAPYRWLSHPNLEVQQLGQRILENHPKTPEQEVLALHHLAMAIAEGKYPVTSRKLDLMRKLEDVIFSSKAFEEIFGGISQGMASDHFKRFTQNLAPLYRQEATDFLKAIQALNRRKKISFEFLRHWNDVSPENPYRFYRKTVHRIKQRWHREVDSDPNTMVGINALRQSLIQPRTFSPDLLLAQAAESGKSLSAFIEQNLPLTLSGLRAFLPGNKIVLSPDYAYIPIERLFFQPYHFAVKRTHARHYQRSIARNAAIPAVEALELKDGSFLISEGHHRSTAAYFENADFIKARLLDPEELTSRPNIGPLKDGNPVPLRWIVADDAIYNHYNDSVGPSVRLEIGPRLK